MLQLGTTQIRQRWCQLNHLISCYFNVILVISHFYDIFQCENQIYKFIVVEGSVVIKQKEKR
jgi:hypothetical protein